MDKDLHSQKADFNLVILDNLVYITKRLKNNKIKITSGYILMTFNEIIKEFIPVDMKFEADNKIWTKYFDGLEYRFDEGRIIWEKSPAGKEYSYEYDGKSRLILYKCPDGRVYEFKYDENGKRIRSLWKSPNH